VSEPGKPADSKERRAVISGLLAGLSLLAGLATPLVGILAPPIALLAFASLVVYRLKIFRASAPDFPTPRPTLAWLGELARFLAAFVTWAAPRVPFVAPFLVFVAVTWPLPRESQSLRFQEQASQIVLVLLIGFVIEAGAIRWRSRPVNWILSLMTAGILLTGEIYALVDLATDSADHADIIAGAMAAGVVAILITAIQGSAGSDEKAPGSSGPN
jgi:hypothetical protein